MKTHVLTFIVILLSFNFTFSPLWAQSPEKMSYQAVIRDAENQLVVSQSIGIQISILQGSPTGTPVFVERHFPSTNSNGLVTIEIGTGTLVSGSFSTIDWSSDVYFLKTETDLNGGSSYTISGTGQLLSVPYSLHSKTAESISGTLPEIDPVFTASPANTINDTDITNWNNKLDFVDTIWKYNGNRVYNTNSGNVGIGTTIPDALLHVNGTGTNVGNVLFTGLYKSNPGNPPASNLGTRMMWYPDKAAFRAGYVNGTNWDRDSIGNYSVAMGYAPKAKGNASVAMGYSTSAIGNYSTAIGCVSNAIGAYSTAMGYLTNAIGTNSIAMGNSTTASGYYSTSMGNNTTASGYYSTSMGGYTIASETGSTAMGAYTTASGTFSTAMGYSTTACSSNETVIGRYNVFDTTDYADTWFSGDPLFIIGNGGSSTMPTNALTVLKNGRMGLQSVVAPVYALELPNNASIGIGSGRAYAWITYSDGRLKTERRILPYGLKEVMQLEPIAYFHHNSTSKDGKIIIEESGAKSIGFIAQDMYKIIPEIVNVPEDENAQLWSMSYEKLTPVLVKAIQEQQLIIEELKASNKELKQRIEKLEAMK
ncbi:MAG: tail fiber domain-containing protein [Bacteroidales bacterium]|nr:tail fiber domain-containing protein [Bacteroidales bacterium]MDD4210644.1 tail fiber domain-containing protein [Bacteroidales bacterium]